MVHRHVLVARFAFALLAAGASLSSAHAQSGTDATSYHIPFHRPHVVGENARIEEDSRRTQTTERREGQGWVTDEESEVFVSLRGTRRVLAVNALGKITVEDVTIDAMNVRREGQNSSPLHSGTVLHVEHGTGEGASATETVIRIGREPVDEELLGVLTMVLGDRVSSTDDSAIFVMGPSRRVGETWNVDETRFHDQLLADTGIDAAAHGTVQLVSVESRGALHYLTVTTDVAALVRTIPGLPPDATLHSASLSLSASRRLGVEDAATERSSETTTSSEIVLATRPEGARADVTLRIRTVETDASRSTSIR